ncbi:MAG TPA: hypothetical protein VEC12_05305 [Bacteroidia bacterium]|nr:hypothetical protein [Bacteroidia bacterium]
MLRIIVVILFSACINQSLAQYRVGYFANVEDSVYSSQQLSLYKIASIRYIKVSPGVNKNDTQLITRVFDINSLLKSITAYYNNTFAAKIEFTYDISGEPVGYLLYKAEHGPPVMDVLKTVSADNTHIRHLYFNPHFAFKDTIDEYYTPGGILYAEKKFGDSIFNPDFKLANVYKREVWRNNKLVERDSINKSGEVALQWDVHKDFSYVKRKYYYLYDTILTYETLFKAGGRTKRFWDISVRRYIRDSTNNLLYIEDCWADHQQEYDTSLNSILRICSTCIVKERYLREFYDGRKLKNEWKFNVKNEKEVLKNHKHWGDSTIIREYLFNGNDSFLQALYIKINDVDISISNWSNYEKPTDEYIIRNKDGSKKWSFHCRYKDTTKLSGTWHQYEYDRLGNTLNERHCRFSPWEESYSEFIYENKLLAVHNESGFSKKLNNYNKIVTYDSLNRITKETYHFKDSTTYENTYEYNTDGFLVKEVNNNQGYTRQLFFDKKGLPIKREYISKYGETITETWEYTFYK